MSRMQHRQYRRKKKRYENIYTKIGENKRNIRIKSLTLLCILHTTFISIRNSKIYSHFAFCAKCEGGSREERGPMRVKRGKKTPTKKNTMFIQFCYISPSSHQMAERKVHSLADAIILRFSLANNQSAN